MTATEAPALALLRTLRVLVLDCQASGATPAHGDVLEIGWSILEGDGGGTTSSTTTSALLSFAHAGSLPRPAHARACWIKPATDRPISRTVRKLTGWDERCLEGALLGTDAWKLVLEEASSKSSMGPPSSSTISADRSIPAGPAIPGVPAIPTIIHFARFELAFLRDLHDRVTGGSQAAPPAHVHAEFPLDVACLHAIAVRLFPDLPRRSLRALAGHLGYSADPQRRALGHVEASSFIWRALVPMLEANVGVTTWADLRAWLDETPAPSSRVQRGEKRIFPLPTARRRALPDAPGVYRFLRPNGDILYVGKAASLKKRVASYFTGRCSVERTLEMLSQAHDVDVTMTASALEAALLESDEIKRVDAPYNVQLRAGNRSAWFASRCWSTSAPAVDETHRIGPLPSRTALAGIAAIRALLEGDAPTDERRAAAVGVPVAFAPDEASFAIAFRSFALEHLGGDAPARTRILHAASRIVIIGPEEEEEKEQREPPSREPTWEPHQIQQYLERTIVGEGQLIRRARALTLLSDAHVAYREPNMLAARLLSFSRGELVQTRDLAGVVCGLPSSFQSPPPRKERLARFDAARYDRLRILATELRRIASHDDGEVAIRFGKRTWAKR